MTEESLRRMPYLSFIRANWLGKPVQDCVGLIKGHYWTNEDDKIVYKLDGLPDVSANGLYNAATEKGPISSLPEIKGLIVWKRGHVIASHPAIIEHDVFDRVQQQISIRSASNSPLKKAVDQYCFSGKIACACCGKNYRRKIANANSKYAKPVWICSTFNKQGKTSCCSRQIPEGILLSVTADVLGLDLFDNAVFHNKIVKMTAANLETIEYEFTDGHRESRRWQNKPRSKKILLQAGSGGGKQ